MYPCGGSWALMDEGMSRQRTRQTAIAFMADHSFRMEILL
jgi:hypothetical protein